MKEKKCIICGKKLKPDRKAVNDTTKKWDGHTYFMCKCSGDKTKKLRISIG